MLPPECTHAEAGPLQNPAFIVIITSRVSLWPESLPEQKAMGTTDRDENHLPIQLI